MISVDCTDHRIHACEGEGIVSARDECVDIIKDKGKGVGSNNDGNGYAALFMGQGERGRCGEKGSDDVGLGGDESGARRKVVAKLMGRVDMESLIFAFKGGFEAPVPVVRQLAFLDAGEAFNLRKDGLITVERGGVDSGKAN